MPRAGRRTSRRAGLCIGLWAAFHASALAGSEGDPPRPARNPPTLRFSALTTDDGLAQNSVFSILQDPEGFLWLGTEAGLNRYDGRQFLSFEEETGGSAGSGALVWDLALSPRGEIWFAGEGAGVCRVDGASGTLHCEGHRPGDPTSLGSDLTTSLAFDSSGRLWVGSRTAGLFRRRADGGFEALSSERGGSCRLPATFVSALLAEPGGRLWVGTSQGLFLYRERRREAPDGAAPKPFEGPSGLPGGGCFTKLGAQTAAPAGGGPSPPGDELQVSALYRDSGGALWVGTRWRGVFHRGAGAGPLTPLALPASLGSLGRAWISSFAEDPDGGLWIATVGQGLYRLDRDRGLLQTYRSSPTARGALEGDSLRALYRDRDDQLWIGMEQAGLALLPRVRQVLGHVRDLEVEGSSVSLRAVFALHIDGAGTVWAGTLDQGLYGYHPSSGRARTFLEEKGASGRPLAGRVYALAAGKPGEVLAGTSDGRLFSLRGLASAPREIADLRSPDGAHIVRALAGDEEGRIWAATWQGALLHLPPERDSWSPLPLATAEGDSPARDPLIGLTRDRRGRLWAGTWSSGLLEIDPDTGRSRRYLAPPEGASAPLRVACVLEASGGDLWVGTEGGLYHSGAEPRRFRRLAAIGREAVFALEEDDEGRIWAGSGTGLWRFDPGSRSLRLLQHRHGLQSNEINVGASARGPDGTLAFGGLRGFNLFHPDRVPEARPPAVKLVELRTDHRRILGPGSALSRSGPVVLRPEERSFSFQAAVLDFLEPRRNLYSYRLRGFAESWTEGSTHPAGAFTNLPAGRFQLEVRGASGDGAWSRTGEGLTLIVEPTLWERRWVRTAVFLLGLSLLLAALQLWNRRRFARALKAHREATEVRQRLLEEREKERGRLALELHDGPLQALHALQLQVSRRRPPPREELYASLKGLVEELRSVCGRLRSPLLQPFGLEPALRELCRQTREQHPGLELEADLEAEEVPLPARVRRALFRISQEALVNALRHGAPGRIRVYLRPVPPEAVLAVEDDGTGFDPPERWIDMARQGHLGILGMAERAESVGGRLEVSSAPGAGTTVRVTVAVGVAAEGPLLNPSRSSVGR